jgi:hypothetical protein
MATLSVLKEASQTADGSLLSADVLPGGMEPVASPLPGGVEPVISPLPGAFKVAGVVRPLSVLFSLSLKPLVLLVGAATVVVIELLQVSPSHPASHKQEPLTTEQLPCSEQSHLATSTLDILITHID